MLVTEIKKSEFKDIHDFKIESDKLYWIKLRNGNIVLSAHLRTEHSSGMAKVVLSESGKFEAMSNQFYITRGGMIQEAGL